jgi:two-component system, OmpR family, sensor histidine kinase QseC
MTGPMASYSLRRRLQALLVVAVAVVWIGVALVTYYDARRELNVLLDAHLAQSAQLLIAQTGHELMEVDTPNLAEIFPYSQKVTFQVWSQDGTLVLRSRDAPSTPLSTIAPGLANSESANRHWRVYSGWNHEHTVLIQVAEDRMTRERLAARIALNAILPLLVGLPLLAVLISWIVTRAVRPLVKLGHEVEARRPATLLRISVGGIPEEAAPLVERLNDLFDRARRSMEAERRFTSNAAHELRNPLAALRVQAEVAAASADPGVSRAALGHVITACDHLARIVQQLLLLARVEEQTYPLQPCRLDQIARRVLADLAPEALSKGTSLTLEALDPAIVPGHGDLLEILVRNLVDNAMRHGGVGIEVLVSIRACDRSAVLTVADTGAGVDATTRSNLGQRFYRPLQTQGVGSGLGLSLVQRIAEIHHGSVEYPEPDSGRGLQVRVMIPLAEPPVPLSDS